MRLPTHRSLYAWEFEKGNRELKVRVEGQLTFNGSAQLLNGALAGCGLAYVPEGMAEGCIAKGRLRRVLADWWPPYSGYHGRHDPSRSLPHPVLEAISAAAPQLRGFVRTASASATSAPDFT